MEKVKNQIGNTIGNIADGVFCAAGFGRDSSFTKMKKVASIAGRFVTKSLNDKFHKNNEEAFNAIVSELNREYGIALRKKTKNASDYRVEIDASEVSKLIQMA